MIQLLDCYQDHFIQVEGSKGSNMFAGNTIQQQSWVEPITWNSSDRQQDVDNLGIEQENRRKERCMDQ